MSDKVHVTIIAEAGVNHNGSLELAKRLVDAALDAGADIVKFQTFKADRIATRQAHQAEYQKKNQNNNGQSQLEMLKRLELSDSDHRELLSYCEEKGIKFWSTAFDLDSIEYLRNLGIDLWKIPSGEITNYPYLKKIASFNQPVIVSTGMCEMDDVSRAIDALTNNGLEREKITLLHCNTEYPTPMEDVNLKAMETMRRKFGLEIGYSDHTRGIEIPIAAVALGATVIEKHITLDRGMEGPDHKASIEPIELKAMVSAIRNVEKALGDGKKRISPSERKNIAIARKSIVASRPIAEGEVFTEENLAVKRPGSGISPMRWEEVLGQKASRCFNTDELIEIK